MKITFKEDFKEKLLHMTVKVSEKKYKNQEDIFVNAGNIINLLHSHYTCKRSFKAGECLNINLKINNNYKKLCEQTWVFKLIPLKAKKVISAKVKK
jgi:hypothetical protein